MNKIPIIIRREYLSRVKKRSFIVMTLLGPLLMALIFVVPAYVATKSSSSKTIAVIDVKGIFYNSLKETESIKYVYPIMTLDSAKAKVQQGDYDGVLYLPDEFYVKPSTAVIFFEKQPGFKEIASIESSLTQEFIKIQSNDCIDKDIQKYFENNVKIETIKLNGTGLGEKSSTGASTFLGLFAGIMIYMFIFMFGTQVLRGVIEEKTSRIIEVIISSVKPFQLMMGKIVGIALVGLTQFILWIVLTFGIVSVAIPAIIGDTSANKKEIVSNNGEKVLNQKQLQQAIQTEQYKNPEMREMLDALASINYGLMIAMFLFYFLFGYLLYAALFAAVGSAVDSEADTQQFMMPITIPLIFAIIMSQFVLNDPQGPMAFWLSIIPFTSPIIMMVRIPFGVPVIDIVISCVLLVGGFLLCTWFAAKIYRTGILMYGKKSSYKELFKWLTYKS